MDKSNIKLRDMETWIHQDKNIGRDLRLVQVSRSTQSLEKSKITRAKHLNAVNTVVLNQSLPSLFSKLTHLVHLKIQDIQRGGMTLLINILQYSPLLESIIIDPLHIDSSDYHHTRKMRVTNTSRIKKLNIFRFFNEEHMTMEEINVTFGFMLQLCPLLEMFCMIGGIYTTQPGGFDLNFMNHSRLKRIVIPMYCRYYTFEHIPSKRGLRWKNYNTLFEGDGDSNRFHINLAWQGCVSLRLCTWDD